MHAARLAAGIELQGIERRYRSAGWDVCIGSSGTILAVEAILRENGWESEGIAARSLRKLRKALIEAGHVEGLQLAGLQDDRRPVLAGGVAILSAVFDAFGIERMEASQGALREGLLYDLLGRIRREDVRDRTIRAVSQRYHVDREQALRVELTARALLAQVAAPWGLEDPQHARLLSWAARLHEIGLSISYAGHHKHGAYIAQHSDMPGFSRRDQEGLAALIVNHRRKPHLEVFEALDAAAVGELKKLAALLRLAVLLNRSRSPRPIPEPRLAAKDDALALHLPAAWLERHPLTRADLEAEGARLADLGISFRLE
jgi:exopolyphosphatase/guanosine-5'-triphosphate,3'-diphosphate pyrophosphatase